VATLLTLKREQVPARRPMLGRWLLQLGEKATESAEVAVALDEAIAERVSSGMSPPTVRVWENRRAVVFPRSRVASAPPGFIDRQGRRWPICARGSGGAAVAHGPGTLNMSVILPRERRSGFSIDDGYRLWIGILDTALRIGWGVTVHANQIEDAFCSGRYDAVVGEQKLAGVAQARRGRSVVIHGTILTRVDRTEYVDILTAAERLVGLRADPHAYDPERIISLHELVGRTVPAVELAEAVRRAVCDGLFVWQDPQKQVVPIELERARQISERRTSLSKQPEVRVADGARFFTRTGVGTREEEY
jgi:octanoyl-[GcvH]:protein N-octanoyltransferase